MSNVVSKTVYFAAPGDEPQEKMVRAIPKILNIFAGIPTYDTDLEVIEAAKAGAYNYDVDGLAIYKIIIEATEA